MIRRDERALSSALSYALIVVLTVSLTAGLVFGTSSMIGEQREQVARDQVDAVGERLASTIMTVDRLNATEPRPASAAVIREFPRRLGGVQYRIKTVETDSNRWRLYVETRDIAINQSFTVRLRSGAALEDTTINGGPLRVYYDRAPDPDDDRVRLENA
ncbi:DUF7266 family protein [Halosimplex marinum]|uniref:DUF7266 family protein n=1 Tax=Halosimplex marinum TaxID=3396620 RepID=UPI003F574E1F